LQGTNTYLIGTGPHRVLIDTGEGKPTWKSNLQKVLKEENATVSTVILTHWHPDHIQGVPDVKSICPSAIIHKHTPSKDQKTIENNQVFTVDGATLRTLHTPGHTTDHMAVLLEEEDNAIFTGDNVLGHGTAVFEDLAVYLDSLQKMIDANPTKGYPGHGAVIDDAPGRIREYIGHRQQRENQVVDVLRKTGSKIGSMDIVKIIYVDVPDSLHLAAERGVVKILEKLQSEGKVENVGREWIWQTSSTL